MKNYFLKIIYSVLGFYAKKVISRHQPYVVAITGSAGKTSTKEAVYQTLCDRFGAEEVRKNQGNLNNEIGVCLTILGYEKMPTKLAWPIFLLLASFRIKSRKYPKYLVLEYGVDKVGDMKYLTSIAAPEVAIITTVEPAHIANFSSVEAYQDEKIAIVQGIRAGGFLLVSGDESALKKVQFEDIKRVSLFGRGDYNAESIALTPEGMEYRISCLGHKISVKSQLLGEQLIYSQLFAFALADHLDFQLIKAGESLEKIKPISGRMKLIKGIKNTTIIDDTYNSNPASLSAGLRVLQKFQTPARKVAIIGNMNELGQLEEAAHLRAGKIAAESCDLAIFVGKNADLMRKSFDDDKRSLSFATTKDLMAKVREIVQEKDLIFIKASQNGNYLEEVTKLLMLEPAQASNLLVRQSRAWLRKKGL